MNVDIPPEVVISSAAGSGVALRWMPGTSWTAKLINVASGTACGIACALFFNWYIGLTAVVGLAVIGFFGGIFGISAMDKVQEFIKSAAVAELWRAIVDWLRKMLGVKETP